MKIKRALQILLKDEEKMNDLIETSFAAIDTDQSGAIDQEELFEVLKHECTDMEGDQLTLNDVTTAMSELDTLSDELITMDEYRVLVVSALQFLYQRETSLDYT